MAGHFRAFIKDLAQKTKCLTELTEKLCTFQIYRGLSKNLSRFSDILLFDSMFTLPDLHLPCLLKTDAPQHIWMRSISASAMYFMAGTGTTSGGRILLQHILQNSGILHNDKKEALNVLTAVRLLRPYSCGHNSKLRTNPQALTHLLALKQPKGGVVRRMNELQ